MLDGNPVTHHGIACGEGSIIDYEGYGKVRSISKDDFGRGRTIRVKRYGKCDVPDALVAKARSQVG